MIEKETVSIELPHVIIPLDSYRRIMAYAEACSLEISGFADITFDQQRYAFIVGEVFLLKQEVSGGDTDINEETLSEFMLQMIQAGKTQLPRLWWHSHVNMQAFFSGIDTGTMKTSFKNDSFMVALVVNKRREMKAMLEVFKPFSFTLDDIPVKIEMGFPEGVPDQIKREVEEKVTEKKWTYGRYTPPDGAELPETATNEIKKEITTGKIYLPLPKKKKKALKLIKDLSLTKQWDSYREEYIWINSRTGTVYFDNEGHFEVKDPVNLLDQMYGREDR